ncbi:phytanoyl-CoA dioxygenase family protein [Jannaschia ovalis]|uniref:Phytanoyl-CoA dioxygenase family protein n=1 Tax=Jannaschia ovalis TaxID=3038773 RepID=A0ABY8LE56_9RHOB|nr:phytanoyl-CoA dioxygenase family protein [Jannaschia sp. GRR-S6-38]WGH78902.1 phytanoyl-CoA dioxygenase family protein [Jannaschia sp. GRR-S6-38]
MLTADQIAHFQRDGFLVLDEVVPAAIRDAVEVEYAGLVYEMAARLGIDWRGGVLPTLRAVHDAGHDWFQPLDISLPGSRIVPDTPFHYGPAVHALLTCDAILDIAAGLLGPRITSTPIQHLRIKPPQRTVAADAPAHITRTMWHQDRAVAHPEADATDMVTVWVAMTDATEANGYLMVRPLAPGQPMLPHCPLEQTAIPDAHLDGDPVPLPVRAGGVVLLDPMIPHAARDNETEDCRWSFDLRYQRTGQPTGRAHFPDFAVRPGPPPDWRTVRDRWLDARARAAQAPHVPIHRWTSDSPHCA